MIANINGNKNPALFSSPLILHFIALLKTQSQCPLHIRSFLYEFVLLFTTIALVSFSILVFMSEKVSFF